MSGSIWTPERGGRLEALAGARVETRGSLQVGGPEYLLTATWIEFMGQRIEALAPQITQLSGEAGAEVLDEGKRLTLRSAVADWMAADDYGVLLSGSAHFEGSTDKGVDLELDATSMHLEHVAGTRASAENLEHLVAWDGFVLRLGTEVTGRGELLEASYETLRMEGRPARLEAMGFALESSEIAYDIPKVLISTDQGRFIGAKGSPWEGWVATYESLQPFERGDDTVMALRHLVLVKATEEVRADWALMWIDRDEWVGRTAGWLGEARGEPPMPSAPEDEEQVAAEEPETSAPTLFGRVHSKQLSQILKELYLEGGVEYLVDGNRIARLGAAYLDLVDGHGWFRDCELWIHTKVRGVPTRIAVRAEWLAHSADGTLTADEARVTDCEFADPDYYIRTQDLAVKPTDQAGSKWDISMKHNSLVFQNGLRLPLPRVHYKSDGRGLPTLGGFRFGESARFGTFVQTTLSGEFGGAMAKSAGSLLGVSPEEFDASWRLRASYYNLRGPLLGTGFHVKAADKFWMDLYLDGVFDTGKDKGVVRSKTSTENDFRWVIHSRGRFIRSHADWIDFQVATQSDAGVQSEFYEGDFIHYDKRDTFVRWRRADDATYYSANARIRTDQFRSDVERLPDLGVLRGLTPFNEIQGVPLLYTGSFDAAYLRRLVGDSSVVSPFDPVFDDGLGDREYLRADTRHTVEAPFELGKGGVRVKPYTSFIATTWSKGVDPDTAPSRGALIAGAEAEATYYRTWNHGVIHDITPLVGVRADLGTFDSDGQPLMVDRYDTPLEGRYFDFGLRSRWHVPGSQRRLDVTGRVSHGTAVATGLEEGWQPMQVLADFFAVAQGIPFGLRHDARYDWDNGDTVFSYTGASILPWETLGFEWAYHRALDEQRDLLYDAMTVGARWDASPKWQIEGRQTLSSSVNSDEASALLFRRIGHDFIFEIEYSFRASEGGGSVSFHIRPELGWRQPGFGLIDTLKSMRL